MLLAFWQLLFGGHSVVLKSSLNYTITPVASLYSVTPDV